MKFTVDRLLRRLAELEAGACAARYLVAFSGGLDSTVLLHALASGRDRLGAPLVAVHCNHALQSAADRWEAHCRDVAEALAVPFVSRRLQIDPGDRRGVEAN